jgi:hypothetical protein
MTTDKHNSGLCVRSSVLTGYGGNTREENTAVRGRLAAIQSHSGGRRRSRRSTGSAERSPSGDPCLGCGRRTAEPLPFQDKDDDRESELSFARHLELEGVTSPTDPPPHASREKMREEEKEEDEGAVETSGGGGGKLEHVRLFDQNATHEDDIFGMHKPLWM